MAGKKKPLTRETILKYGIPIIFIPGLILASLLGWNWQKGLASIKNSGYKQSEIIFPNSASVVKVSDGDTIEIDNGQTIRLIGINAPDRGEKGFSEATEYLKDLIEGETVQLEYDSYQEDKFGRILAYVFETCRTSVGCKDGKRLVNYVMVKKGLAQTSLYEGRSKLKYQDELEAASK